MNLELDSLLSAIVFNRCFTEHDAKVSVHLLKNDAISFIDRNSSRIPYKNYSVASRKPKNACTVFAVLQLLYDASEWRDEEMKRKAYCQNKAL